MICKYQELTRLEMEQVDRENTIVLIPLGVHYNNMEIKHHLVRIHSLPQLCVTILKKS